MLLSNTIRLIQRNGAVINNQFCRSMCTTVPKNPLEKYHSAAQQPDKGSIYDKKPLKLNLEEGKTYFWCACGKSKNQPMCDGTHKNAFFKIKLRPVRFTVTKTGDYYICNCKQTNNRPFCDGTHKEERIQQATLKTF